MKSNGAIAMENKLGKIGQNSFMDNFVKTDDILKDMTEVLFIVACSFTRCFRRLLPHWGNNLERYFRGVIIEYCFR